MFHLPTRHQITIQNIIGRRLWFPNSSNMMKATKRLYPVPEGRHSVCTVKQVIF